MNKELNLTSFATPHEPRSYVNTLIRHHHVFTAEQRLEAAQKAGWNVFQFPSEMLAGGDLLSDSGTTVLTSEQFAALVLGDEAYGSNWGYFQLIEAFERVFGISQKDCEVYLFHQGRAAERALFTQLRGEGLAIPANNFFDTTRANIEARHIVAEDLVIASPKDSKELFKGNIDGKALERFLGTHEGKVPLVYCTITNNTGGGQPVSMENIRSIRKICDAHKTPFFLDACRFAENAWFIQRREPGYAAVSIADIVKEMFSYCDGFIISLKKDGLANMGGALVIRKDSPLCARYPDILENLRDYQILVEGHPTYGGLSGRDIMTIVVGLTTVVQPEYLQGRIVLVEKFGEYLQKLGIPVVTPFGGHAVYIDVDEFFKDTGLSRADFGGISLTALLLLKGVRLTELGAFAFGTYDPASGKETFPPHNYVRAAVPRNKYELQDLYYVADCVKGLYDRRKDIPKAICVYGKEKNLRHFKARFTLGDE